MRDGRYREYRKQTSKRYVYTRETVKQKLLMGCSFTDKAVCFRTLKGYPPSEGKLMLTNDQDSKTDRSTFVTRPYETRVYLFQE